MVPSPKFPIRSWLLSAPKLAGAIARPHGAFRPQVLACAEQPRHHGADRDAEDLGHLPVREAPDVRQHDHLAKGDREALGGEARLLDQRPPERRFAGVSGRRRSSGRRGPGAVPARGVAQERASQHREDPRLRRADVPELVEAAKRLETGLLDQVFRPGRAREPARRAVEVGQMGQDLLLEPPDPGRLAP
jgi:hypothetical protein